jgi:hypothetical protein
MAITSNHVTGFIVGVGISAVGFYAYQRNQAQVDGWLRKQGINVGTGSGRDPHTLSLEDLVAEKERLEDIIAEREMAAQEAAEGDEPAAANV